MPPVAEKRINVRKAVIKIHIGKDFCKDTTPAPPKSAITRRQPIRSGQKISHSDSF